MTIREGVDLDKLNGFRDFFMDDPDSRGGGILSNVGGTNVQTCASSTAGCHELPLGVYAGGP